MNREPERLVTPRFDMLVVGGGIYGAWTAYAAALRGLRVAIVDKGDWASGTSSSSSKLIHGGLRYLESLQLQLVRQNLHERERLLRNAPHRVRQLRFLMPVFRRDRIGPLRLKAGLWLYDRIAATAGASSRHHSLSNGDIAASYPFIRGSELLQGFTYCDCQTDDARFTLEVVAGAIRAGAVAVNYCRAVRCRKSADDRFSVELVLCRPERRLAVEADVIVNAAGPWCAGIDTAFAVSSAPRLSKGVHLVFPALPTSDAIIAMTRRDQRILFLIPWYGRTLVGTTDSDFTGDPDRVSVRPADESYLFAELRSVVANGLCTPASLVATFAGLRSLQNEHGKPAHAVTREWTLEEPAPGYFVSVGGKLTSARADAETIVDRVGGRLQKQVDQASHTKVLPLPWAPPGSAREWMAASAAAGVALGVAADTASNAVRRFGATVARLWTLVKEQPCLAEPIIDGLPFCKGEIVHAASHEMVVTLTDVLRRRVPIMLLARPDETIVRTAADLVAPHLGWNTDMVAAEIKATMSQWETS